MRSIYAIDFPSFKKEENPKSNPRKMCHPQQIGVAGRHARRQTSDLFLPFLPPPLFLFLFLSIFTFTPSLAFVSGIGKSSHPSLLLPLSGLGRMGFFLL